MNVSLIKSLFRFSGVALLIESVVKSKTVLRQWSVVEDESTGLSLDLQELCYDVYNDLWPTLIKLQSLFLPLAAEITKGESNSSRISRIPLIVSILKLEFLPLLETLIERAEYEDVSKYVKVK